MITTPLLPPYPTFSSIDELIEHIWKQSAELEEEYYRSNSMSLIHQYEMNLLKIQYWESVSLKIQAEVSS